MGSDSIIEVQDLTKRFKDIVAVDRLSFSVSRGEIFGFLGPNGAGKTTTIRMLTTLLHPTSGSIRINGYDPQREQRNVRKSFGIVFQDPSLDDELTALENMEYHGVLYGVPREVRKARIMELLKFVELWDRRNDLVKHFSGGMKRRLEIARGLIHHPTILFLDEPTLGLDPQTRSHIWNYIGNLNREEGVTIFLTTHYMEEAERVSGRVAIIDDGKIRAIDSPAALKTQTGSATLEEAFLAITGREIRNEEASSSDHMRLHRRVWHR
jgi:ABC-2 type transport system ATP-binding protein